MFYEGYVKLSEWAKDGKMPVPVVQTPSGSWLVIEPEAPVVARVVLGATWQGLAVSEVVTEVGSGLNGPRRKLHRILSDPTVTVIVVEHRDRLARFGVEHLEAAVSASGRRLIVLDAEETTSDLVRDITEVLTSMGARLYGQRSAKNRAA